MATFNKFNQFPEDLAHKVHHLGSDELIVLLTNVAPDAANAVAADITQIDYANCSSRVVTRTSSGETAGTYELVLTDLTLTASDGPVGPFRYVVLANNTPAGDPLIGYWDRGSSVTLSDGETILLDFAATTITLA